jgi:hypothetical protein
LGAFVLGGALTSTQIQPWDQKFNKGQNVAPIYGGWERNSDGSATMVFGYLNRNYVEELLVPVGPNNNIEPGGPDRGQPEYFYPRINRYVFKITVPKNWGEKEIMWTLTVNGKTEKAYGSLLPEWEIDRYIQVSNDGLGGSADEETLLKNEPPKISIAPESSTVTLPSALTLTASVTDDGIPSARPPRKRAIGQETPPTLKYPGPASPVNVPLPAPLKPLQGLSVAWFLYRGPAKVTFEPWGYQAIKDGKATARAAFQQPGTYMLRAVASDGMLLTPMEATITVTGAAKP